MDKIRIYDIAEQDNAAGKTIHLILELTHDGTPALTAYRRVVIEVERQLNKPRTRHTAPPTKKGKGLIPISPLLTHYIIIKPKSYYNIKYGFACFNITKIEQGHSAGNTDI